MAKDFDLDEWSNIGNILVRQGVISRSQLERLLEEQGKRQQTKLGELAVELKLASREEVEDALREQQIHRVPAPTDQLQQAQSMMQQAFATVSGETKRFVERTKTAPGMTVISLNPEEA